jgi:hypothetical protein
VAAAWREKRGDGLLHRSLRATPPRS